MTLEGNGATRLLKLFGNRGASTTITLATVVNPSPISVRVDGDSIDTPAEGIIVAESADKAGLSADDRVIVVIGNDGQLVYVLDKAVI